MTWADKSESSNQSVYLAYIRPIADQVPRLPRCRAPSAVLATQKLPAEQRRPRDARQVLRLPRKSQRQSGGDQGTPGRRPTLCRAPSAAPATQKAAETKGRQGVNLTPLQSTKCRACHAKSSRDQGTPGRTSDPLQSTKCRTCHAKPPAERRRPRDARAYIRPLAEH